jgi:hypothetical protein
MLGGTFASTSMTFPPLARDHYSKRQNLDLAERQSYGLPRWAHGQGQEHANAGRDGN